MHDTEVPTAQFHPYQPPGAIPQRLRPPTRLERIVAKSGVEEETVRRVRIRTARYLRRNRWSLAAAAVAVAVLIGVASRRASRELSS